MTIKIALFTLCIAVSFGCLIPFAKHKHTCSIFNHYQKPAQYHPQPVCQPPKPQPNPQLRNDFTLRLEYACRSKVPFSSCTGNILWNGVVIYSIRPCNYAVNPLYLTVIAKVGHNSLQFAASGTSDSYGLTIDNIKLIRNGDKSQNNIVINGEFEHPNVNGHWKIFNNIQGWKGHEIEIGRGSIYNPHWRSQVCELDSNKNSEITQSFQFSKLYELEGPEYCRCDNNNRCGCGECHECRCY